MDDEKSPVDPAPTHMPAKKKTGKKILFWVLIVLVIVAAAGGTYYWRDQVAKDAADQQAANIKTLQQAKSNLEKQLADEKATNAKLSATPTPVVACTNKAPSAAIIENIKASVTSGNTAALEGYMAPTVTVILAASEGIGPQTPKQAVSDVSNFITGATSPWNFALTASVLSSYGKGFYAKYFPSIAVVGKSANSKVIAFSFDCNGKISTIFQAANENLLQ